MHLCIPLEIRCDRELDHEARTSDGLDVGTEIKLGELVDQLVDGLAHLREADELSNLSAGEVVVSLPGKVLLLDLSQDILGQALEVAQGSLGTPHPLVNHLAPIESAQGKGCPATAQADLKDGSHDTPGRLLDVDHVRQQCETIQLELGDVCLQENVDLRRCLVCAAFNRHRHAFHELLHLNLLLLAHRDVLELVRQGEETQQLNVGHHWPKMLVVCGNGWVLDVVVTCHTAKGSHLDLASSLIILDEVVLVQHHERSVDQVHTSLLQESVFLSLIGGDAVEAWRAHHANVKVGVSQPVHSILASLDGAQHHLGIHHVRQATKDLRLNRKLLVQERQVVLELAVLGDDNAVPLLVVLRPSGSSNHLHHIHW
mmetsp:Transcript_97493/g.173621  ORF Transcript_97493/g.173621 Transcript_97493/m.173621 type:complete len:371 (+) Transcript_97493:1300-2412(+)